MTDSCDYQGHEFGASYPDSVCIDGRLWDADSCDEPGGPLYHGGDIPCPKCNLTAWCDWHKDGIIEAGALAACDGADESACPYPHPLTKWPASGEFFRHLWLQGWHEQNAETALDQLRDKEPENAKANSTPAD